MQLQPKAGGGEQRADIVMERASGMVEGRPRAEAESRDPSLIWTREDEAARSLPSVFLKVLRAGLSTKASRM